MNCQVCGKYSGYYPLCAECNELKEMGEVVKCDKCGNWKKKDEKCTKCSQTNKEKYREDESNDLKCIICGKPSNGKHFCKSCYAIYKDRSVDIRITHCTDVEILDEYGSLKYKCDDGRKVRSRAEALISNFFFKEKIRTVYEKTIYYTENGEDKTLHPDFYLPDYDIYIEYNELTNKPYISMKEYAQKIYKSLNKNLIVINDKDLEDLAACLKPKLGLH